MKVREEHEARKKKVETSMRLASGFMILAFWNLGYVMGTLYMQIVPLVFSVVIFNELRKIRRNDQKDRESKIKVVEWMIFIFTSLIVLPKGSFRREIMENSGFSAEKNPLLFGFLYEYQILFITGFSTIIFLTFILGLKKDTVKY